MGLADRDISGESDQFVDAVEEIPDETELMILQEGASAGESDEVRMIPSVPVQPLPSAQMPNRSGVTGPSVPGPSASK